MTASRQVMHRTTGVVQRSERLGGVVITALCLAGLVCQALIAASLVSALWHVGNMVRPHDDNWRGFVYPDRRRMSDHVELGRFHSLASCRFASRAKLTELHAQKCSACRWDGDSDQDSACWDCDRNPLEIGDYECGSNCEMTAFGLYQCTTTEH